MVKEKINVLEERFDFNLECIIKIKIWMSNCRYGR